SIATPASTTFAKLRREAGEGDWQLRRTTIVPTRESKKGRGRGYFRGKAALRPGAWVWPLALTRPASARRRNKACSAHPSVPSRCPETRPRPGLRQRSRRQFLLRRQTIHQ